LALLKGRTAAAGSVKGPSSERAATTGLRRSRPFATTLIGPTGSAIAVIQVKWGSVVTTATVAWHSRRPAGRERVRHEGGRSTVTLTDLIIFLVIGGVAGWLAGVIVKGGGFGLIGDIVVGVIGSLIGGWLFGLLGIAAGGLIGSII